MCKRAPLSLKVLAPSRGELKHPLRVSGSGPFRSGFMLVTHFHVVSVPAPSKRWCIISIPMGPTRFLKQAPQGSLRYFCGACSSERPTTQPPKVEPDEQMALLPFTLNKLFSGSVGTGQSYPVGSCPGAPQAKGPPRTDHPILVIPIPFPHYTACWRG